ncbi:MAG TPA: ABC transporter permease [Acidimicrobiia bacterium]|nr:ABC transporter permease [Acidimicrobiia bacterium]
MSPPERKRVVGNQPPIPAVVLGLIGLVLFFVLPLTGLLWRAPWSDFTAVLRSHAALEALRLSLICSLSATGLSVLFGIPIAWLLARGRFAGLSAIRALALLPLVLPPVVGGVALFYAFGRRGLIGQWLDHWFGVQLPFTIWAAIIAETFVAMPFFVITVEGALRSLDTRYEDAAATYGAGPWTILRRVTLPMIAPSIAAGMALTWARALGEFGATITFAGNFPGKTQTLPLAIYLAFENNDPAGIILSILLLTISIIVLVIVGSRVFSDRLRLREAGR